MEILKSIQEFFNRLTQFDLCLKWNFRIFNPRINLRFISMKIVFGFGFSHFYSIQTFRFYGFWVHFLLNIMSNFRFSFNNVTMWIHVHRMCNVHRIYATAISQTKLWFLQKLNEKVSKEWQIPRTVCISFNRLNRMRILVKNQFTCQICRNTVTTRNSHCGLA